MIAFTSWSVTSGDSRAHIVVELLVPAERAKVSDC